MTKEWSKAEIDLSTPCLTDLGTPCNGGYRMARFGGPMELVHKVCWEAVYGPTPEGLCLDHLCRNRGCRNVRHLEPVTRAENVKRSPIHCASRTHCPQGHPYDAENIYWYRGRRYCRKCKGMRPNAIL